MRNDHGTHAGRYDSFSSAVDTQRNERAVCKKSTRQAFGRSWIDPDAFAPEDISIPVEIQDMSGDIVVRADIILSVTRRPE